MTRTTFALAVMEIAGTKEVELSASDYGVIEYVHTWHPAFAAQRECATDHIAYLNYHFGMSIINDMLPTAKKAFDVYAEMLKKQEAYDEAKKAYDKLCTIARPC